MSEIGIKRGNRPGVLEVSISGVSDPLGNLIDLIEKFYINKLKMKANFRESESLDTLWITVNTPERRDDYLGRIIIKESFVYNNYKLEFDILKENLNKHYNSETTARAFLEYYKVYTKEKV